MSENDVKFEDISATVSELARISFNSREIDVDHIPYLNEIAQCAPTMLSFQPAAQVYLCKLGEVSVSGIEITKDGHILSCDYFRPSNHSGPDQTDTLSRSWIQNLNHTRLSL